MCVTVHPISHSNPLCQNPLCPTLYKSAVSPGLQVREVDILQALAPQELLDFATAILSTRSETRRKMIVAVRGSAETARAAQGTAAAVTVAAADGPEQPTPATASTGVAAATDAVPAAGGSGSSSSSGLLGPGETSLCVPDVAHFKRCCEVWPSVSALQQQARIERTVTQQQQQH